MRHSLSLSLSERESEGAGSIPAVDFNFFLRLCLCVIQSVCDCTFLSLCLSSELVSRFSKSWDVWLHSLACLWPPKVQRHIYLCLHCTFASRNSFACDPRVHSHTHILDLVCEIQQCTLLESLHPVQLCLWPACTHMVHSQLCVPWQLCLWPTDESFKGTECLVSHTFSRLCVWQSTMYLAWIFASRYSFVCDPRTKRFKGILCVCLTHSGLW